MEVGSIKKGHLQCNLSQARPVYEGIEVYDKTNVYIADKQINLIVKISSSPCGMMEARAFPEKNNYR
jgi:hypothetical protein